MKNQISHISCISIDGGEVVELNSLTKEQSKVYNQKIINKIREYFLYSYDAELCESTENENK